MPSKEIGRGSIVRKKACMAMVFLLAVMLLTGCGLIKIEEGERTPLEYTNPCRSSPLYGTEKGEGLSDDL